jgi:hypothetical protein
LDLIIKTISYLGAPKGSLDAKKQEALEHYRHAGEGLLQLKLWVGHGEFEPLKDELSRKRDISRAQIGRLMKLANEWPVSWERWQEICGNKKPTPKNPTPIMPLHGP